MPTITLDNLDGTPAVVQTFAKRIAAAKVSFDDGTADIMVATNPIPVAKLPTATVDAAARTVTVRGASSIRVAGDHERFTVTADSTTLGPYPTAQGMTIIGVGVLPSIANNLVKYFGFTARRIDVAPVQPPTVPDSTAPIPPVIVVEPGAVNVPAGTMLVTANLALGKTYNLADGATYRIPATLTLPHYATIQCPAGRAVLDCAGGGTITPVGAMALRGLRIINCRGNAINGNIATSRTKIIRNVEIVSVATDGEDSGIWAEGCNWSIDGLRFIGIGYAVRFYNFAYANDGSRPPLPIGPNRIVNSFAATVSATGNLTTSHYRVHGVADGQTLLQNNQSLYRIGGLDLSQALIDPTAFFAAARALPTISNNWVGIIVAPNGGQDTGRPGFAAWRCTGVQLIGNTLDGCGVRIGVNANADLQRNRIRAHGSIISLESTYGKTRVVGNGIVCPNTPKVGEWDPDNKVVDYHYGATPANLDASDNIVAGKAQLADGFTAAAETDSRFAGLGQRA